jgi:hypothetical protein
MQLTYSFLGISTPGVGRVHPVWLELDVATSSSWLWVGKSIICSVASSENHTCKEVYLLKTVPYWLTQNGASYIVSPTRLPLFFFYISSEVTYLGSVIFSPWLLLVNPYLKTKLIETPVHSSGTNLSSGMARRDCISFFFSCGCLKLLGSLSVWDRTSVMLLQLAYLEKGSDLPNYSFFFIVLTLSQNLTNAVSLHYF